MLNVLKRAVASFGTEDPESYEPAQRDLIQRIDLLQDEAQAYRSANADGMSLEDEWEVAGHRFLGNHWMFASVGAKGRQEGYRVLQVNQEDSTGRSLYRATINRTGPAILANVANQTAQPLVVRIDGSTIHSPTHHMLSREGGQAIYDMIYGPLDEIERVRLAEIQQAEQTGVVELATRANEEAQQARETHLAHFPVQFRPEQVTGHYGPSEPLNRAQVAWVKQLIHQQMLEPDDLIAVNDTLRAQVAQEAFDHLFEAAGGPRKVVMNEFLCNVYGHQPLRIQYDEERECLKLENTHILNVWIDPTHDDVGESDYLVFDQAMSIEEAIGLFGELVDESALRKASTQELQDRRVRRAAVWDNGHVQRDMVIVRTAWLRHQMVPMTIEEALERELVTREPVLEPITTPSGEPVLDAQTQLPRQEQVQDPETGQPAWRYLLANEQTADGEPVEVQPQIRCDHGTAWPNTRGLRQVQLLPGTQRILSDIRCPYLDIPFAWNINIPRPDGSPFGQGEPVRLEDVSQQINRFISYIINHARYYQWPQVMMPMSLHQRLEKSGHEMFSRPGAFIPIPDDKWQLMMQSGGFSAMVQQPPTMPQAFVAILERLLNEHDRLSGNVEVRQGRAPFSGASGSLVRELSEQASGPLALRSKFTEWMLERTAKIALDAMVRFMSERRWQRLVGRYEIPVLRLLLDGMRPCDWNITVEIASGRGMNRQIDEGRSLQKYQLGLQGKRDTLQDLGDDDPEARLERLNEERLREAQGAAPVQAAAVANPTTPTTPTTPTPPQPPGAPATPADPAMAAV